MGSLLLRSYLREVLFSIHAPLRTHFSSSRHMQPQLSDIRIKETMSSKKHKRKPSDQLSEASPDSRRSRRIAGQPADDQQPLRAASLRSPQMVAARASRRANADIAAADIDDELQTRDEDFRDACLQRDGHRCVVSGVMDAGRWGKLDCPAGVMALDSEAAHIIPYAYGSRKGRSVYHPPCPYLH